MNYQLLNGADLAFIGDAYYELYIRTYLLSTNITKSKELKKLSLKYVTASAHAYIFENIKDSLTKEEMNIFLRGRNAAPVTHRKNLNRTEYQISSGLEAVIGYLYLKNDLERLNFIMEEAIKIANLKE